MQNSGRLLMNLFGNVITPGITTTEAHNASDWFSNTTELLHDSIESRYRFISVNVIIMKQM